MSTNVESATPYAVPRISLFLAVLLSWVDAVDRKLSRRKPAPRQVVRVARVIPPWSETPGWDAAQEEWAGHLREIAVRREPGRHRKDRVSA